MWLANRTSAQRVGTLTSVACLATAVACTGGGAPELTGLTDQVAQVGTEFKLDLSATDPDGDRLSYSYRSAGLDNLGDRAAISVSPSGAGVFRWTPIAADVGSHAFDFIVSDGDFDTVVTINIDVRSAIGSATAPVFRQPLGSGTTIDLSKNQCLDLGVVIEDQDTAHVDIGQEEPVIEGAMLTQEDGQTATWRWCPTRAQEGDQRHTLILSASDGDNPKTVKNYLIVLRGTSGSASCPGSAPTISHTPASQTTRLDLKPVATISDDKGLKDAPLLYYSLTNPGASPNLAQMTQLTMVKQSGTATSGTWAPNIPNPVASMPDGTQRTLYYVIVADDNDDEMGNCDHTTQSTVYQMTVTAGGSSTAGLCSACTADSQCGAGNLCVYMGSMGDAYCVKGCGGGCPAGYTCSAAPIYSVDGNSATQCVPQSGSCASPTGACVDDTWEENDSRTAATANPALAPSLHALVSCPSTTSTTIADDDWYKIELASPSRLNLEIAGDGTTDLDLHLYRADGTVISKSTSYSPDEAISTCLPAATYYVKINGYGSARSEYLFDYARSPEVCNTSCVDDASEDDDTYSQARVTSFPAYTATAQKICTNDDDWYAVLLYGGDKLTIDLTFTQPTYAGDLDLHLYKDFVDLWPCSASDVSTCSAAHGQSADANEHAEYIVPSGTCAAGCDYYVVVRGFDGATNTYGITLGIQ